MTNTTLTTLITESIKNATNIEAEAKAERERLETMLRSVKGTRDDMRPLKLAPTEAPRSLPEQAESLLRQHVIMHERQLGKALGLTDERVRNLMGLLARGHKAYNIGTSDHPRWVWCIGEQASPAELTEQVQALISAVPLTLRQLEAATGARRNRVNGALIQIQRSPALRKRLENLGTQRVHVHFLRPAR